MRFLLSCDDGSYYDLHSIELLKKYELPCIFYIPGTTTLTDTEIILLGKDYTVGGHTTSHPPDIKRLRDDVLYRDIQENKEWLETLTQRTVDAFCYPRGRHNEKVREAVKRCGFKTARTTLVNYTDIPEDSFRQWTSCHASKRKEYANQDWLKVSKALFQLAKEKREKGYFHFWWHSFEIELNNEWDKLNEALAYFYENLRTP